MVAIASKNEICNMALAHIGSYGTINDIDSPETDAEVVCARWYDVTRAALLRRAIPNFAMARRVVAKKTTTPPFGYAYSYEYPSDCLRILGFGDIDAKSKRYNIELSNGEHDLEIQIDDLYPGGLPLRFIIDIKNINLFTPDFKILLSWVLASNIALPITQKRHVAQEIHEIIPNIMSEFSGISAQENPPVRRSVSKFKASRFFRQTRNAEKK